MRRDGGVHLDREHLDDLGDERVVEVELRHRRQLRGVRVLQHHAATGEIERGAADLVDVLGGHDHRQIVTVLDDVELAGLVDAPEVHVVRVGGAGAAGHLQPQREGLGVGLRPAHFEHTGPGGVGDSEERCGNVGHTGDTTTGRPRSFPAVTATTRKGTADDLMGRAAGVGRVRRKWPRLRSRVRGQGAHEGRRSGGPRFGFDPTHASTGVRA